MFRNQGPMIEEYDVFENHRSVVLYKLEVWARVLKLPDKYLIEEAVKGMCRTVGVVK